MQSPVSASAMQIPQVNFDRMAGNVVTSIEVPVLSRAMLNPWVEPPGNRKTSIICTIGPKTNNIPMIQALRKSGMNIARLNFSHGTHEYHASCIANVRASFKDYPGRQVAIALDTKGPEIRTGLIKGGGEVPFSRGHIFMFTVNKARENDGDSETIYIDYANLPKKMAPGKFIYIDDGTLSFKVIETGTDWVKVEAMVDGRLSSRKGVNLPNTDVDLPSLSEKDKADLAFGVEQGVDMIFASFIREAKDVLAIRAVLGEKGKDIHIISKIENHQGLDNFDEILAVTDGVMVARGDLGTEIPVQKVFIAQKMMIAKCNIVGKPVICATQMLHTMITQPRPTRAEVSDVANAVLDGADCVMLSGETASGSFPLESVETMHKIALEAESVFSYMPYFNEIRSLTPRPTETTETVASSAVNASLEEMAGAIVVLSTSGTTPRLLAKYRPRCPIIVVTRKPMTARRCHLYRGCYPFVFEGPPPTQEGTLTPKEVDAWRADVDQRLVWGINQAKSLGMIKGGEKIIAIQGWRGGVGATNTMRVLTVE